MGDPKPRVFIGSSSEAKDLASEIQTGLRDFADVRTWWQGIIEPSENFLDGLIRAAESHDIGVFVLHPDDLITSRNEEAEVPRDNVIFELGLFIGKIGKERTFFIVPRKRGKFHLLSDLAGHQALKYDNEQLRDAPEAAVGTVCRELEKQIKKLGFDVRRRKQGEVPLTATPTYQPLRVGSRTIDWVPLLHGKLTPRTIYSTYQEDWPKPPPDYFAEAADKLREKWARDKVAGEPNIPFNGLMYKLIHFNVDTREIIDGIEHPALRLRFCPTDYAYSNVTDRVKGNPERDKYVRYGQVSENPIPEFASIVGVNINAVTSDNILIVARRSMKAHLAPNSLHTSVAENLSRPADSTSVDNLAPDLYRAGIRGFHEELNLDVTSNQIQYTTFGVHEGLCQYSLIGFSRVDYTWDEVIKLHPLAPDGWENKLVPIPFDPKSVASFVISHWNEWFPIGLAAVVLSLLQAGYPQKEVDAAFL
jgi:hypothetical protein